MKCQQAEPILGRFLERDLPAGRFAAVGDHVRTCQRCAERLDELQWVVAQLKAQPRPTAPPDLAAKLHVRLAAEAAPARWTASDVLRSALNWPSLGLGAAVAAALMFVVLRGGQPSVGIQVAAVPVDQNVGVQIAFGVDRDVKDVTFDIKLSDGLRFVDAKGQPVDTQEVSWKGELMRGKTVVPVTVRGIRPGKWDILAIVRKNQMARATQIIVPVQGDTSSVLPGGEV